MMLIGGIDAALGKSPDTGLPGGTFGGGVPGNGRAEADAGGTGTCAFTGAFHDGS